jgi:hypothetical protein
MQREGVCQHEEQLDKVGNVPVEELVEYNLLEEVAEKHLSDEPTELESAVEWKFSAIGDQGSMGDQVDLPIDKEEVQQGSLHERRSQSVEKLEEVIEEIRRRMLRSAQEAFNKRRLNRG